MLNLLIELERNNERISSSTSRIAVDSQSVKSVAFVNRESKGIDGNKKINGRKRYIAVDSQGLPRAIHISKADVHDSHARLDLLWQLENSSERLELIVGDKAYGGMFKELAMAAYNIQVETSQRPPSEVGFVPQKGRWQVERSFA